MAFNSEPFSITKPSSWRGINAIVLAIALVLLVVLGILLTQRLQDKGKIDTQAQTMLNLQTALKQMQSSFDTAIADLERYRSDNQQLNAIIDAQTAELTQRKAQITKLLKRLEQADTTQGQLSIAQAELSELIKLRDTYGPTVNALRTENETLKQQNLQLAQELQAIKDSLTTHQQSNQQLRASQKSLEREKRDLLSIKQALESKVNHATALTVLNIRAKGQYLNQKGKLKESLSAELIKKLQISFDIAPNVTTPLGEETFYLRILAPNGVTLGSMATDSGIINLMDSQEQVPYTTYKTLNFTRTNKNITLFWQQNNPFLAGNYKVEIYNKGLLAGKAMFELN